MVKVDIVYTGNLHCDATHGPSKSKIATDAPTEAVLNDPRVVKEFEFLLCTHAAKSTGSSNRVCRAILLSEPPSLDAGEVTDKGSINQRAVLKHRAALVEELYANPSPSRVISIAGGR